MVVIPEEYQKTPQKSNLKMPAVGIAA